MHNPVASAPEIAILWLAGDALQLYFENFIVCKYNKSFWRKTMRRSIALPVIASAIASASNCFAADCSIDHYNFIFGQDTSTHMTVKSGKTCGSNIRTSGGGLKSLAIAQSPQSGSAMTPTNVRWEYRSKPGYSGKDSFVVQGSGEAMGNKRGVVHSGNVNINVDVDVVP